MTKLEDIQKAVTQLTDEERKMLVAWLAELDWQAWDDQIEREATLLGVRARVQPHFHGALADGRIIAETGDVADAKFHG
jgi:hypothetical protein